MTLGRLGCSRPGHQLPSRMKRPDSSDHDRRPLTHLNRDRCPSSP
ncbi:hypothetical protein ppKF707_5523 [Metapseudomonas furukawaii]|uniref:Uncharacterized protein n=1 Tax=Metapseudomonas furukawaii TaxID=1149133 RepID=A0AAD1FDA3_METFU|nr:hypothetical protein ppKF707_5523 [Pseudomonas furukawaii]BAU71757.1 hypothetical protein KF707C_690 [Pseudomonas furukawaii]